MELGGRGWESRRKLLTAVCSWLCGALAKKKKALRMIDLAAQHAEYICVAQRTGGMVDWLEHRLEYCVQPPSEMYDANNNRRAKGVPVRNSNQDGGGVGAGAPRPSLFALSAERRTNERKRKSSTAKETNAMGRKDFEGFF